MFRVLALGAVLIALALPSTAVAVGLPTVHCAPGDPVVWVNTSSNVYHLKGSSSYGKTKAGKYACTSQAKAMGARQSGTGKNAAQVLPNGQKDTAVVKKGHLMHQDPLAKSSLPDGSTDTAGAKTHKKKHKIKTTTLPSGATDTSAIPPAK